MEWTLLNEILSSVKDLLLQVLIVLFPVFVLQAFWIRENSLQTQGKCRYHLVGLVCSLGILLCIIFPVSVQGDLLFELYSVPLVISFLYGGWAAGAIAFFSLIVFKLVVSAQDLWFAMLNNGFVLLFTYLFQRRYPDANRLLKISFFTTLICLAAIFHSLYNLYVMSMYRGAVMTTESAILYILYPLVSMISIWMIIHMVENIREKQLMELEIQKAERLNIIGHLAASVAHEIRNPMTVVRGFMQIFDREAFVPDSKKVYLKLMIQELDRAESIINDYLTLARPRLEKQEKINIGEQIQSVMEIISSFAMLNNISITYEVEEKMLVSGIPEKLNQVLINLIKNAIEASPEGEAVHITAYRKEDKIWIEIQDSGIGLSPEEVKRLGMPFYTTKENGTGLGLMVCFQIIKAMNGKIEVLSQKNIGTHFIIKLPEDTSSFQPVGSTV
ncbi:ATP-binding protein [Marinicrinis sediminis]|uniref:histidine kinase n=1 Tax=Marinicrinis sediminis TaxID=1652465 RepID=A0ABW5R863_9BACL